MIKYTFFTTIVAALIALGVYVAIDPAQSAIVGGSLPAVSPSSSTYWSFFLKAIPSNIIQPFAEGHVVAVLFLAVLFSFAILSLPSHHRKALHPVFAGLYAAVMKITEWIVDLMPVAVWGFLALFMKDLQEGLEMKGLLLYLLCVLLANTLQAAGFLPLLLRAKGVSAFRLLKDMFPALSIAFFTKSSSGALPMAIRCASDRAKISPKIANFALPLCTTINMNACAAFILTTVLFVSMSNGATYTYLDMLMWVGMATIAAVGNAGVPMGCYFLSSAFLARWTFL